MFQVDDGPFVPIGPLMTMLDHDAGPFEARDEPADGSDGRVGLDALATALGIDWSATVDGVGVPVIETDRAGLDATLGSLDASGQRRALVALVATSPDELLSEDDPEDPLVRRTVIAPVGVAAPFAGRRLRGVDLVAVPARGLILFEQRGVPVATSVRAGQCDVVIVGGRSLSHDRFIAAGDNSLLIGWALSGRVAALACAAVRACVRQPRQPHPEPLVVTAGRDAEAVLTLLPDGPIPVDSPTFVDAAARAARLLPAAVHDALVHFADHSHPSGALLLRGLPVGDVPPTPTAPGVATGKDHVSELVLLAIARRLGQPVGYLPEHGGQLVQDLVPTPGAASAQTSTSSSVTLEFHTEAAFHPHKPRYLLLMGLRRDPLGQARTLLCSISSVLESLPLGVRAVLSEARFRTGVDESYTNGRSGRLGRAVSVLSGDPLHPTLTFDADLMVGVDDEATAALEVFRQAVHEQHIGVALDPGDVLVVDNLVAVHGRSPFQALFDGNDRWLQRSFVVADLAASAGMRAGPSGRVITTRF